MNTLSHNNSHEPEPPAADPNDSVVNAPHATSDPSSSISLGQDAPVPSHSQHASNVQSSSEHQGTATDNSYEVNPFAPPEDEPVEN